MDDLFKKFKQEFGKDAVWTLEDEKAPVYINDYISTGSFALDYAIGKPGIPVGRIIEFFGHFSTGKSSLCASILGSATRQGHLGILIDTEHSWTDDWIRMYKIAEDKFFIIQPKTFQDMFLKLVFLCQNAPEIVKENQSMVIVVDSLSAVPTAEEVEGEKEGMAMHAKLMAKGLRVLTNLIWDKRVSLVCTSQLKDNPMQPYAVTKIGGNAIDFHAAVQVKMVRMQKMEDRLRLKTSTVKNKVGRPFKEVIFDVTFAKGVDDTLAILQAAVDLKMIEPPAGGWYEFEGKKYRSEDLAEKIREKVCNAAFKPAPEATKGTGDTPGTAADSK